MKCQKIACFLIALLFIATLAVSGVATAAPAVYSDSYAPIVLNVPWYCQRSSGDCGIAAVSMIEAYFHHRGSNETEVYNSVVNAFNSFNLGNRGAYGFTDIGKDLNSLYNALADNHPILIYRVRGESDTHWAVIYGYQGSTTSLQMSGFKVLSPFIVSGQIVGPDYWNGANNTGYTNLEAFLSGGYTFAVASIRKWSVIPIADTSVKVITLSNWLYPTNKRTGEAYEGRGIITSPNELKYVEVYVNDANKKMMFWVGFDGIYDQPGKTCGKTFNIGAKDPQMTFAALPAGTYDYIVFAVDVYGYTVSVKKTFTVSNSATTSSTLPTLAGSHDHTFNSDYSWVKQSSKPDGKGNIVTQYKCYCGETKTETKACTHSNAVLHSGKPSTCLETGWEQYYSCDACGMYLSSDRRIISGIPYLPLSAHNYVGGECTVCHEKDPSYTIDDNTPQMEIGSKTVRAGETVQIPIVLKNTNALKSIALSNITYDTSALELVGGEWKPDDSMLSDVNLENRTAVIAFGDNTDCNGEIFALTFKVKDHTADSVYYVSCDVTAKRKEPTGEKDYAIASVPGSVQVVSIAAGDVNGDEEINSDDAIYLLYHTLLPDLYPLNQSGDFDGNGDINSDDAIYLLYHTLLPDLYPLK